MTGLVKSRLSVKQRLILEIERKLDHSMPKYERFGWEHMLYELRNRGSGPLPFYFRELAREWGIEKMVPRRKPDDV